MALKVLFMLDSLNRGGSEILCLDVCRNAKAAGLDLIIVASGGGDLENDFANSGADFVHMQRRLPIDPALILRLRRIIKERDVKLVHAQQSVEAIHLWLATRGTGVKCVLSLHNYILDEKNRIATKFIVPKMDAVCSVSKSMQEWFRTSEKFEITDRFRVLPNGVDLTRLKSKRPKEEKSLRRDLGIKPEAPLLGMVGNFYTDERKDQWTVCLALPAIIARFPELHFVFVGAVHTGAEEYEYRCVMFCQENHISNNVHFIGKRADIPDILRELDLFVFSSLQEGFGIAPVEAMMLGVPALVSDIPPLLEVIGSDTPEGRCAEVFATRNADDLAQKVVALLEGRSRLNELGEKARLQTQKYYSIETHIRELKRIYDGLFVK